MNPEIRILSLNNQDSMESRTFFLSGSFRCTSQKIGISDISKHASQRGCLLNSGHLGVRTPY